MTKKLVRWLFWPILFGAILFGYSQLDNIKSPAPLKLIPEGTDTYVLINTPEIASNLYELISSDVRAFNDLIPTSGTATEVPQTGISPLGQIGMFMSKIGADSTFIFGINFNLHSSVIFEHLVTSTSDSIIHTEHGYYLPQSKQHIVIHDEEACLFVTPQSHKAGEQLLDDFQQALNSNFEGLTPSEQNHLDFQIEGQELLALFGIEEHIETGKSEQHYSLTEDGIVGKAIVRYDGKSIFKNNFQAFEEDDFFISGSVGLTEKWENILPIHLPQEVWNAIMHHGTGSMAYRSNSYSKEPLVQSKDSSILFLGASIPQLEVCFELEDPEGLRNWFSTDSSCKFNQDHGSIEVQELLGQEYYFTLKGNYIFLHPEQENKPWNPIFNPFELHIDFDQMLYSYEAKNFIESGAKLQMAKYNLRTLDISTNLSNEKQLELDLSFKLGEEGEDARIAFFKLVSALQFLY